MHIGGQDNLDHSLIATIIIGAIKDSTGNSNYFEDIATLVKNGYFDEVVKPKFGPIHDRIRWIERNHYPEERFHQVLLEWDSKLNKYFKYKCEIIKSDWILERNKMQPY